MNQSVVSNEYGERLDLLVRQEELILDVTERLTRALDDAGITMGSWRSASERAPDSSHRHSVAEGI